MPHGALDLVIDTLACPVCGESLSVIGDALACAARHSFDIAKQGYVSLLGGGAHANTGDTAAMVAARHAFLAAGHYAPIAAAASDAIPPGASGLAVDVAGGTGHYLAAVLERHPELVGLDLDLSKPALRTAARAHPRLATVGADVWRPLPVKTGAVTCILSVFGPRNAPEFARVLAPGGRLIVVTPTERHLGELVERLGMISVDPRKQGRLDDQLSAFTQLTRRSVEYTIALGHDDILNEVLMGPSAHHVDAHVLKQSVATLRATLKVTISVTVSAYAPHGSGRPEVPQPAVPQAGA